MYIVFILRAIYVALLGVAVLWVQQAGGFNIIQTQQGQISYYVSSTTDAQIFFIYPQRPSVTTMQLIFTAMSIDAASLTISDSQYTSSGVTLFSCVGCGSVLPPPIISTTGSVTVVVQGNPAVNFRPSWFTLMFIGQITNPLATTTLNTLAIAMNMGYGKISPYTINGIIPPKSIQTWNITENPLTLMTMSFSTFRFGNSCTASLDVYDGLSAQRQQIFHGCVDSDKPKQWLYARSGMATVILRNPTSKSVSVNFLLTYSADNTVWRCGSYYLPDVLLDSSMVLYDGTRSNAYMRRGDTCTWLISPLANSPITLFLRWVSIKDGGSVIVYDNSNPSGYVLWNGVGPTYTTPPPITSTGNALFVVYNTNTKVSDGFYGFRAEYEANYVGSKGVGSGNTLLSMSSVIDLVPPGTGLQYTPNNTYVWFVQPSKIIGTIAFVFSAIQLPNPGDQLVIYDGADVSSPVLGTFKGTQPPLKWFFTSGRVATVKFISDPQPTSKGNFKLSYFADGPNYHCGFTTNPALLTANSMQFTDGSMSTEVMYAGQSCKWLIQPRNSQQIYLFFTRYTVLGGQVSIYIGDPDNGGSLFVSLVDTNAIPTPMTFQSSLISIIYTSTSNVAGNGFAATYFGLQPGVYAPGDGILRLYCSSMISFRNLPLIASSSTNSSIAVIGMTNDILINPRDAIGQIYFAISSLSISSGQLVIYDGSNSTAPMIANFSDHNRDGGQQQWLATTSNVAFLHYTTEKATEDKFDVVFYSDGPNSHCGFSINPATLRTTSMIFTDGSSSSAKLNLNQNCQWIIDPGPSSATLVLELLENDLFGAQLEIYDGTSTKGDLLWMCNQCSITPNPIISQSGKLFVWYRSFSNPTAVGYGFRAIYWTMTQSTNSWQSPSGAFSLDMPFNVAADNTLGNKTAVWNLGTSYAPSTLIFSPRVTFKPLSSVDLNSYVRDGRPTDQINSMGISSEPLFHSLNLKSYTCGTVRSTSSVGHYLVNQNITFRSTQRIDSFLLSNATSKRLVDMSGSWNTNVNNSNDALFSPSNACKYHLDSGSTTSITIVLANYVAKSSRLRVYTGVYGTDNLALDSAAIRPVTNVNSATAPTSAPASLPSTISAPCGKATIILELNSTFALEVDYGLELSYYVDKSDHGQNCEAYIESLKPKVVYVDPYIPYYIASGCLAFLIFVGLAIYLFRKKYPHYKFKLTSRAMYQRVTPNYPRYSPRLDRWRNKMLPRGRCCVCSEDHVLVFKLPCHHGLCREDLCSYLESALGDISQFPVKCPMHFEACQGSINAYIAKRVLSELNYEKFIEFSDRATYGEGMRCIFCNNFVNFPSNSRLASVECPYCVQRFCFRCKKPWHYGVKCPLETVDDELDEWKLSSGAQKCPSCQKLIEKDDPNTCNHMVHKITDAIPCIRDRTDFCYLCGEEVLPDYPHDEVRNPTVNHFPDGVFQKCRHVMNKEREAERERLKRLRRMKNRNSVVPVEAGEFEYLNQFDSAWESSIIQIPNSGGSPDVQPFSPPMSPVAAANMSGRASIRQGTVDPSTPLASSLMLQSPPINTIGNQTPPSNLGSPVSVRQRPAQPLTPAAGVQNAPPRFQPPANNNLNATLPGLAGQGPLRQPLRPPAVHR